MAFTCDDFVMVELCAIIRIKRPIRPGTDTETCLDIALNTFGCIFLIVASAR